MRIRKILGVLSILAVFIFVLTGCSKYSFDVKGTYKDSSGQVAYVITDKEFKIKKTNSDDFYIYDYERIAENFLRVDNNGTYRYYFVYENKITGIGSQVFAHWECTKE